MHKEASGIVNLFGEMEAFGCAFGI